MVYKVSSLVFQALGFDRMSFYGAQISPWPYAICMQSASTNLISLISRMRTRTPHRENQSGGKQGGFQRNPGHICRCSLKPGEIAQCSNYWNDCQNVTIEDSFHLPFIWIWGIFPFWGNVLLEHVAVYYFNFFILKALMLKEKACLAVMVVHAG